uniref:Osteopetrosis-associated transmembrane protein 1 n=1 Tax=Rhodnius prolixus TaxID=13249 RepID=T1HA43_RHOPR
MELFVYLKDRGGESCKDELFNLDRLQAVDAGFKYVKGLWERASCDSCFVLDPTGCPTTVLSPAVQEILNISDFLNNCIDTYHNGSVVPDVVTCKACGDNYLKLNNLYNSIKADNGEINYCMDIIDLAHQHEVTGARSLFQTTAGFYKELS